MRLLPIILAHSLLSFYAVSNATTLNLNGDEDDLIFKSEFEVIAIDCSQITHPPGITPTFGIYRDYNDGFNFGESTNASFIANVRNFEYLSLSEFSYPVSDSRRRIVYVDAPTSYNLMDQATLSISECPGDFTETANCLIQINNQKTLFITTKDSDPSIDPFCFLDPTKNYYYNLIMSPEPFIETPSCNTVTDVECAAFSAESL